MRALPITGEYPSDWKETSDRVWAEAGHRCIRCGHPIRKGNTGRANGLPCGQFCNHGGPFGLTINGETVEISEKVARFERNACRQVFAQWRIGTVHHLDGNKANCVWWNLLALCQRCHLTIQSRVNPQQPYIFEHDEWFKPYAAGFYAKKYHDQEITRDEAMSRLEELLAIERLA